MNIKLFLVTIGLFLSSSAFAERVIKIDIVEDSATKKIVFVPSTIEMVKDEKVVLEITNKSKVAEEFESHTLHREKVIPAGKSVKVKLGPLKVGTYEYIGEFNGHKGQVVVKETAASTTEEKK